MIGVGESVRRLERKCKEEVIMESEKERDGVREEMWFVAIPSVIPSDVEKDIPLFVKAASEKEAKRKVGGGYTLAGRLKVESGFEEMVRESGREGCLWIPEFGGVWMIGESLDGCVRRLSKEKARVVEIL